MGREAEKRAAAARAASNTPDEAERPGAAPAGGPPELQEDFSPATAEHARRQSKAQGESVPGYPDDVSVTGGYEHGGHTFISQSTVDPETNLPVQRTVCAVCGAEVVYA
jgi:hypothetical protein